MKSFTKLLFAAAASVAISLTAQNVSAQAIMAGWASNAQVNGGGQPPALFTNTTAAAAGVTVYPFTKGFGLTNATPTGFTTAGVYGGNNWTNSGIADSEANSIANGLYMTYAIQAQPGYRISFTTNILFFHNSATGPHNGELQYSTDGITYTDLVALTYGPAGANSIALTNALAAFSYLQNVPSTVTNFFRIVNWGATSTAGTWYINNASPVTMPDYQVIGAVSPILPSVNIATWWPNPLVNGGGQPPALFTNNTAASGVTVYPLTKGFGLTNATPTGFTTAGVYGGNNWTNSGIPDSEANSLANGLYMTYAIQAQPGFAVSFYTNAWFFHNSATGPHNGELQYSTDGITYADLVAVSYGASGAVTAVATNDLTAFTFLQNVPSTVTNYFRVVNWGATGTAGTWYMANGPAVGSLTGTNDFAIIGSVASLNGVLPPTNLVVSPSASTNNAGQNVSFTVSASGSPATNFWYSGTPGAGTLIPSATSSTLTLTNVTGASAGTFFVILTNSAGSATSAVVSLTVIDPILQVNPSSVEGLLNGTVQFGVTVAGAPPTYQWYYADGAGNILAPVVNGNTTLSGVSTISGATSSQLTIADLQNADVPGLTNLLVVAQNAYGSVTSSVASVILSFNTAGTLPTTSGVLALWDFDGPQFTNVTVNPNSLNNPAPFIGFGTAAAVGTPLAPPTSPFSGATDPNDVGLDIVNGGYVFTPYGFDQPSPNFSWGVSQFPVVGTNKANGVQFNVSTIGARNITVHYDGRVSATASEYDRLQYTTNGTTWIDYPASSSFSGLSGSGNAGYHAFDYNLVGFPGVDNNPNFGFRVVTEWQNTATYGIGTTNTWVGTANLYSSGASGNTAGGTFTFDLVAVLGDAITNANTAPTIGFLASMPVTNGLAFTNTIDTNMLVINFTASSTQMDPSVLTFTAQPVNTVSAGPFTQTVNPSASVIHTGSTNFQLSLSFPGFIPDANDAAPIQITATDTNGNSAAVWFLLSVGSINQPPTNTLTAIRSTNLLVNSSLVIPFNVGSVRDTNYSTFTYSFASDNNTVIPVGNMSVSGSTPGNTTNMLLTITPAAGQIGDALINVTVNDNDPSEPRSTTASIAVIVRPNTNIVAIDYFNYDSTGPLDTIAAGYWQHLSGINNQMQAGGGFVTISQGNTENLQAQLLGNPYKPTNGATLYASYVVTMNNGQLPTGNGSYITTFNSGSGNTSEVEGCLVVATNGAAPGFYRMGIANANGATALTAQMFPVDLSPGVAYFVVTALSVTNTHTTLWVSPTNFVSQSVTDTSTPANPTNIFNIVNFELRESGTVEGISTISSLLVGTTFNSVFYPPQANLDVLGVTENTTGNLLSPLLNDGGSALRVTSASETDGNGAAAFTSTNVTFTPIANFVGTATVNYTVTDDMGNTSNSVVLVSVTNNPPLANPDTFTVDANSVNDVLTPLTNDVVRTPGGTLGLVSVSETDGNGTPSISGTTVLFTPTPNYSGPALITYLVTDNVGGTNSALITVNVANLTPIPLTVLLVNNTNLVISWTNGAFSLQSSTNVTGPYVTIPGATSPYTNLTTTNVISFFRLFH